MNTKTKIWITGTIVVVAATASWFAIQHTDQASTMNTKTKANQMVYKQEVKPAITSAAKPLVTYTKTHNISSASHKRTAAAKKKTVVEALQEKKIFSTDYLPLQEFTIDSRRDTQLLAAGGMKVSIPANAFTYKSGKEAQGKITIEMKEAFTPQSIVMANLVTMKGKELLESGGMYYLNAKAEGVGLAVADGKELTMEVPALSKKQGMELYEGKQSKAGLDWANPVALNKEEQKLNEAWKDAGELFDIKPEKTLAVAIPKKAVKDGPEMKDSLGWLPQVNPKVEWMSGFSAQPGVNGFAQDTKLNYLMTSNRLGWANIDRLYHDPRSRRITFVTDVENKEEFENVYITMMFKSQSVYLPGYQKKDGTYSFTHGDYEEPVLPVGEKAAIMVSAYKDGQQYFAVKNVTIDNKMNVVLTPVAMGEKEIEQQVNNSL
jgi:hypothetical protein